MVLLSENVMHLYGIRLCSIEIKISTKLLEQKKSSIALIVNSIYSVHCSTNIIEC